MFLGFDTSNYTTSLALFDGKKIVLNSKKLLQVKKGERGLRQSDALFQHIVNLPQLVDGVEIDFGKISAVGVSTRPRNIDGSYMPCFLAGVNSAVAVSRFCNTPLYKTSHQVGHILSALYSTNRLDLVNDRFIAFHISGGTTEALLVEPHNDEIIKATVIAQSSDLKAGQAIDRAGVMMGFDFPCGRELDRLSLKSNAEFKHKISINGLDCSLSGVENKAKAMLEKGESKEDISKFVITYICDTVDKMTKLLLDKYGDLPIVFAGGVMSNSIINEKISNKYSAYFAKPEFSCDNACGIAIYAYLKSIL